MMPQPITVRFLRAMGGMGKLTPSQRARLARFQVTTQAGHSDTAKRNGARVGRKTGGAYGDGAKRARLRFTSVCTDTYSRTNGSYRTYLPPQNMTCG